jgi:hypothetical protein
MTAAATPSSTTQRRSLEQTYRDTLRWYPKSWRRRNEDAVLGTLLDVADEDNRSTPGKGELANLRANALAIRLGPLGRIPAPVRDRVVALLFGLGFGIAIVALAAPPLVNATLRPNVATAPISTSTPFFYGVWVLALVASVAGWKWAARGLVVLAILVSLVLKVLEMAQVLGYNGSPTTTTLILMGVLALVTFIGDPFSTRTGRRWIAVSASSWTIFLGFTIWYQHATKGANAGSIDWFVGPLSQWMGWLFPLAIILALILWRAKRSPWAPAILLAEIPIMVFALLGWQDAPVLLNALAYTVAIAATAAGCYAILRGFGLRIRITRT